MLDFLLNLRNLYERAVAEEGYAHLLKKWDKREIEGNKLLAIATNTINQSLHSSVKSESINCIQFDTSPMYISAMYQLPL